MGLPPAPAVTELTPGHALGELLGSGWDPTTTPSIRRPSTGFVDTTADLEAVTISLNERCFGATTGPEALV